MNNSIEGFPKNSMENGTNGTTGGGNYIEPEPLRWVLRLIFISVFLVGSIGNLVVCSAIVRRKRMRTSNNIFTFNLAVSDLMIVLIYVPTQMAAFENNHNWPLGNFACQIAYITIPVCLSASIATLLAITSDRYRAIAYPMKPKLSSKSVRLILISIWSVSLIVALPLVFVAGTVSPGPGQVYCDETWPEGPYSTIYWISIFVIQYVLPLGIILVLAILIAVKLRRSSLQLLEKTSKILATAVRQRLKQSAKITNMLIALVLLYATCMLPQHIVYLLGLYGDLGEFKYRVYIIRFANVFPMANSALNPIAYGTLNKEFKAVFKNFFKCQCGKDTVEESPSEFSRSRRFRLAVYRHVDEQGHSVLEYGRKWRRKSSTHSGWGAGLLQRRKNSSERSSGKTKDCETARLGARNNRPNGHINNNSCQTVTDCVVSLMDKQDDISQKSVEKSSPVVGELAKLLPSPDEQETGDKIVSFDSAKNNCAHEKRTSFSSKKKNENCSPDSEVTQCLLCSQSSTESNTTHDSMNQINSGDRNQEDFVNISNSLEWDSTIDASSNLQKDYTTKDNENQISQLNYNYPADKSTGASDFSIPYDPVQIFFDQRTAKIAGSETPLAQNFHTEDEDPDVVSNPSVPILQTATKYDRNMFALLESVRETVV